MNAISYSLFGSDPVYCAGALRNAELAHKIYPGWKCVFYVSKTVPKEALTQLKLLGSEVRQEHESIKNEMFFRFLIADDISVDRFIVRDADSRLSEREANAVKEWEASGLKFHSMRDHPHHTLPLGGGLWGAVGGAITGMKQKIIASGMAKEPYDRQTQYGSDQTFLSRAIWPEAKKSCMAHDSCTRRIYPEAKPFPDGCKFDEPRFCGEILDEKDTPHPIGFQQRVNFMTP